MGFVVTSYKRILFLWLFFSRTLNRTSLANRRHAEQLFDQPSTVIFVASIRDFQISNEGQFVPDKFEIWRQEINSLGLSSKLVVMPFSDKQNKEILQEALYIEPFVWTSSIKGIGLMAVFRFLRDRLFTQSPFRSAWSVYATKQIWKNFLLCSKPRVLIGIGMTDVILEVCSELGIKTIECQHGVFNEMELKRWWAEPSSAINYFPDLFVTWDRYYCEIASKLGINALTLGYPYDFSKIVEREAISQQVNKDSRGNIVATLSCRETNGIDPWGMINTDIDLAISALIRSGIRVLIRVHPMAEKDFMRRFNVSRWLSKRYPGSQVIFPSEKSILQSLKMADIHLTVSSSTILEAAYLGIPTLCLSNETLSWFPKQLVSLGFVKQTNEESILEDFNDLINVRIKEFTNPLDTHLFRRVMLEWTANSNE